MKFRIKIKATFSSIKTWLSCFIRGHEWAGVSSELVYPDRRSTPHDGHWNICTRCRKFHRYT